MKGDQIHSVVTMTTCTIAEWQFYSIDVQIHLCVRLIIKTYFIRCFTLLLRQLGNLLKDTCKQSSGSSAACVLLSFLYQIQNIYIYISNIYIYIKDISNLELSNCKFNFQHVFYPNVVFLTKMIYLT